MSFQRIRYDQQSRVRKLRQRRLSSRREVDLRALAEGGECQVQLPLNTNHDPATVVLAHVKDGWCGSVKPFDVLGVRACHACHDEMDRRTQHLTAELVRLHVLEALYRQILEYCEEGVLTW